MKRQEPFKFINKTMTENEEASIEILEFLSWTEGFLQGLPNSADMNLTEQFWEKAVPTRRIALSHLFGKGETDA